MAWIGDLRWLQKQLFARILMLALVVAAAAEDLSMFGMKDDMESMSQLELEKEDQALNAKPAMHGSLMFILWIIGGCILFGILISVLCGCLYNCGLRKELASTSDSD
eukprot:TRINITY_DN31942_c0_g1_i1.p2 TRINITY_DN31942_c0_g1~~TRINITY_DN31942_c0_g1_i1.p2  ORF type:complete len:107 (+),score=28.13 TRINITY_DN31942_c0_g1_i1:105-425(+)